MAKRRRRRSKGAGKLGFYLFTIRNPESLKVADAKARELRAHLAVFPDNIPHSSSYVELDDPTPPEYPDLIRRLDRTFWPKLI